MQKFLSFIEDVRSGEGGGSELSHSWEYVTADDGESELVWRALKRDLEATGLSADLVEKHRPLITRRLKEILEAGELTASGRGGQHSFTAMDPTAEEKGLTLHSAPSITEGLPGLSESDMEFDRIDAKGNTFLHLAASAGNVTLVHLLLEKGSDVTATNASGWTVLRCAQENGHHAVLRAILEHCRDEELVRAKVDNQSNSVLHCAVRAGDTDAVTILLKGGADPSCRDRFSITPLHLAAWRRDPMVTQQLLDADADIDIEDFWGDTPFELAVKSPLNPSNKADLIRTFLSSRELPDPVTSLLDMDEVVKFLSMESIYDESSSENIFEASTRAGGTAELLSKQFVMNDLAEDLWDMIYGQE